MQEEQNLSNPSVIDPENIQSSQEVLQALMPKSPLTKFTAEEKVQKPESSSEEPSVESSVATSQEEQDVPDTDKTSKAQEKAAENYEEMYQKLLKESSVKDKRAEDNRKHARQIASNMSNVKRHIQSLVDNGDLEEELANSIIEVSNKNIDPDHILSPPISKTSSSSQKSEGQSQWDALVEKAREPLEKYLDISPHAETDRKNAEGFQIKLGLMGEEERKVFYDTLKKHQESPRELLKAMLEEGGAFWDSRIGKGIIEHGDLIGIIDAQTSQLDELQKKLDKLEKRKEKEIERSSDVSTSNSNLSTPSARFSEAERMKQLFLSQGVPKEHIDYLMKGK